MTVTIDRRAFLKASALAAATALLDGGEEPFEFPVEDGLTWDKAPCRFCGTGCQVQVGVRDGRVMAIAGDRQAPVNKGLLCVKGYHVGGVLYGTDRLRKPQKRVNGRLVDIEWDEAIAIIAERVALAPDRFGIYGSGQWTIVEGFIANLFMKGGLASNHIDPNARLCMASAVTGFIATFGVDEPAGCYDDFDACDTVILWGNNPAEMHPILWSRLSDRRSRGEPVEVIDIGTRRTRTSDLADHFLLMKPHADLAILLGIMNLLVTSGRWDRDFVAKHAEFRGGVPGKLVGEAITADAFFAALAEYPPARCAELSGLSVADLELLADRFADSKRRILSLWCMGMNQHTSGTAVNSMVHGVHLLSGHWGKPGDTAFSLTGQPSACGTAREVGTVANGLPGGLVVTNADHRRKAEHLWNLPEGRINAQPGFHAVQMWEDFCREDGHLSTLWVQVTNPGQSLPNLDKLFALADRQGRDRFLIVSDVYPTATTAMADLVLPSAMWVEKNGIYGNSERRTHQWFKMVEPPGEARDDAWQMVAVARRLFDHGHAGMRDRDGRFLFTVQDDSGSDVPVWDWSAWHRVNVDRWFFERYRPFTRIKHKDLAPYEEYVKARGLRWPVVEQSDGSWRETRWRFIEGDDPYVEAGRGIDFYHGREHRAAIFVHPYEAPPEAPDAEYPFWLCTGRVLEHWHTGSMTMRIPQLRRAMPHAYAELHADDARRLGLRAGDHVALHTRRGRVELPIWIDGRARPPVGTVFVPFFDERRLINLITLDAHDPFSKEPDYKKCAVRIERVPR